MRVPRPTLAERWWKLSLPPEPGPPSFDAETEAMLRNAGKILREVKRARAHDEP